MDFEQTPEGAEAAELAGLILEKHCTPERLKEVEAGPRPVRPRAVAPLRRLAA